MIFADKSNHTAGYIASNDHRENHHHRSRSRDFQQSASDQESLSQITSHLRQAILTDCSIRNILRCRGSFQFEIGIIGQIRQAARCQIVDSIQSG